MQRLTHRFIGWTVLTMATACAQAPAPVDVAAQVKPAAGPPSTAPRQISSPPPATPWPEADSCRDLLAAVAAMPEAELHRLDPATATLAFGVRDGSAILPPAAAETAVAVDLPLPAEASAEFHCLVLVDRAPTRKAAPRRPLAHEVVRSTYRGGSERRTNPEYVALRQRLRDVEGGGDAGIMATGDPGLDLIGLIGGVVLNGMGAFSRAQNEAAARQRLAVTPATLATQSWEPYTFEVTTVEASRAGLLRAALVDRVSNLAWPIERNVVERRSFRVANGRRARDRGLLEGGGADLVETADLAVWEQGGLRPSLLAVAKQLAAVDVPGVPGGIAALRVAEPLPEATGTTGRTGSVEQVVTADGVRRYRLRELEPATGVKVEP